MKIGKFKPEYISKMDFYLEALDRQKKKENPSVGIRSDVELSAYDLENFWNGIYVKAQEMDQRNDDMGVQLLRDGAEMCFEIGLPQSHWL